jgi:D-apiose dehydrogenase
MTLRVAAFGTGYFSHHHYDAWKRIPGVRLVGIGVGSNLERGRELARRYGAPEVSDDAEALLERTRPDLVDIITTPESHRALVQAAARRRIPIVCQKPLAPTFEEAVALVETAEAAGTLLVAHENWRFRPWNREVRRLIAAGAVGTPLDVTFRLRPGDGQGPRAYLDRQPYFQTMPRFLVHETGIHMIDVFRHLIGEITGVFARLRRVNPVIAGEDAGHVIFAFESGAAGLLDGNRLLDHPADNPRLTMGRLLVEGTEGGIRVDGAGRIWRRARGGAEREHAYAWESRGYAGDSVHALQAHVVEHLRAGTPVDNTGRAYLRNLSIEEAVYRSHAEGRWIDLPA